VDVEDLEAVHVVVAVDVVVTDVVVKLRTLEAPGIDVGGTDAFFPACFASSAFRFKAFDNA